MEKLKQNPVVKKLGLNRILLVCILILMFIVFKVVLGSKFPVADSIKSTLNYVYFLGFLSLGVTFVIATGGIDFSIGPVMFCCALISGYCMTAYHVPCALAMVICVLIGFAFGMFLNVFSAIMDITYTAFWQQLIILAAAIIVTAIGVSMMVNMHFVPNPADGLAQAIGLKINKDMGFGKNMVDCFSVASSLVIGLIAVGQPLAFGIGTIGAMIGVGRCIALFNKFFKDKMCKLAGMQTA